LPFSRSFQAERAVDRREDRLGLGQAARAKFAAGHRPFVGFEHRHAVAAQRRDVAARRGMLPHPHVHRRGGEDGLVGGEQQSGCQIVGDAGGHLGHQIGGGGCDHDEIGFAAELDMAHLGLVLQVPQGRVDLTLGERGQSHRHDEMLAALGQHAFHADPRLAAQADQLASLIGRDAAADDEQDAFHRVTLVTVMRGLSRSSARTIRSRSASGTKTNPTSETGAIINAQ
jgi:hypothetical protein